MTVNEIIAKIKYLNDIAIKLEEFADDDKTISGQADTMRSAAEIVEEYVIELGRKKIVN